MRKILSIIEKNLKLIIRSKISALIILFGPLLIMLIVGLAFNSQASLRINVGYYSETYNNLTASFIDVLEENNYNVKAHRTIEDCGMSIVAGESHICISFPENFQISNNKNNEIVFMVDNSKINFFETVVDSIEKSFNDRALELTQGMTQELLSALNETQESISSQTSVIDQLKSENKELKSDIDRIGAEVGDLDLDFNYKEMGIATLEDESDDVSQAIKEIEDIAEDAIDESLELIDYLETEIAGSNITGEDDILEIMNETAEELVDLLEELNDSTSFNTSKLSSLVDDLKTDLVDVEDKFDVAADARDTSVSKIQSINKRLNTSLAKILIVEKTFKAITSNIAGTEITDLESITKPIVKKIEPVVTEENQLNFFFPYLVVLITMFIGLLLSSTLVIMEKTSRAHFRNFVTPTGDLVFIAGSYITTAVIMILQLIVVLAIFSLYFQKNISDNLMSTFLVLGLLVTLFSWLGMIIGNVFNSEETGTLASISIGSILLFVSDLIFPLERMSDTVAYMARTYNPFVIGTELLRKTIIHKVPIGELGNDLYLVVSYLAIFFTLVMLTHKMMKKSYLLRWGGYVARRELRLEKQLAKEGKLLDFYQKIEAKDYFTTKEDRKIPTFKDLVEFAENVGEDRFKDYVTKTDNLFADWVEKVLKNDPLALKMRTTRKRAKLIKVMKAGLKAYEKLIAKIEKAKHKPESPTAKEP